MLRKLLPYIVLVTGIVFFLFLAYSPVVWNLNHVPKNQVYIGGDDYPIDMLGDLLIVREGYNGNWLQYAKITTDVPSPKFFLKEEYILIGQLARMTRTDPLIMFHVTRAVISFAYLLTIFSILWIFFRSSWERVVGFFLVAFGGSFFLPTAANRLFLWDIVYDSLPVVRLTQAAHHYLLAGALVLWIIFLLSRVIDDGRKTGSFIAALVSGAAVALFYSPDSIVLVGTFPFFLVFWILTHRTERNFTANLVRVISILGIFVGVTLVPLLYVRYLSMTTWDFVNHPIVERLNPFFMDGWQFLSFMGLVYVFAWAASFRVFREKKTWAFFFLPWLIIFPLAEYVLSDMIGLNRVRVFLSPYFVIFGILAVWGIGESVSVLKKIPLLRRTPDAVLGSLLVVCILLAGSYTVTITYFERQRLCYCADHDFGFPTRDLMNAFSWLSGHTGEHDAVLSAYDAGLMIPAFSGNDVYTSWWYRLTELDSMKWNYDFFMAFYGGSMSEVEARDFLDRRHISYVFLSGEERSIRPDGAEFNYPFLKPVFRSGNVLIYKVI